MGPRVLAAIVLLSLAGQAHGHAVLLDAEPAHRAVLGAAPTRIVLRFNEAVTPISLRVLDASGRALDLAPPRTVDRDVIAELPAGLAHGTYVVSYRVTSADGHPVGGAILFAVGAAPEWWRESAETGVGALRPAVVFNRGVHLLCLFLAAGGLLFSATVGRQRSAPEAALAPFAAAAAATAILGVYLHSAALAGDGNPLAALFWRAVLAGPQYVSAAFALAGLALAFVVAPRLGGPVARAGRIAGAVLALAATGITGHSAAAGWVWWPVAALHLVAAGFWLGALRPLISALRARAPSDAATLLRRFSRVAVPAVAALALAGLALALQRMDTVEEFFTTDYGNLVLAKMAGAAALVALAALNKYRLTPAAALGSPGAARRLRTSIAAEFVLMAGVVGIAALLAHTDPHAGHEREDHKHHDHRAPPSPGGATLRLESGGRVAAIEIYPARPGRNALTVAFVTREGAPLAPLEAVLELALPAAGIEPFSIKLAPLGQGKFAADISELALAGRWQLRLDALITDFEKAIFRGEVEIK